MLHNRPAKSKTTRQLYIAFGAGFILGSTLMMSPAIGVLVAVALGADFMRRLIGGGA